MNAVHGSILENLKLVEIIYEETVDAFKKDRTNTSDSKEVTVNQFIGSYLPSDYQIKTRSKIYSRTQETNNIDCVVLSPHHPRLITPKREVVIAEGVFAAIEVKPDIRTLTEKGEFYVALNQIKSVKNIIRDIQRLDFSELFKEKKPPAYYDKIPSVIFSSKSSDLEKTIKFMIQQLRENKFDFEEFPDVIVSLEKGIITYSPHFEFTGLAEYFKKEVKGDIPKRAFISYESKEKSSILILFLRLFLNFTPSQMHVSDFIIKNYLSDIKTSFKIKIYDVDKISRAEN